MNSTLYLDGSSLTLDDIMRIAHREVTVALAPEALPRMQASRDLVEQWVRDERVMYGITTGFGEFSNVSIGTDQLEQLQRNLILSHAVGCGDPIPVEITRILMGLRANALATGIAIQDVPEGLVVAVALLAAGYKRSFAVLLGMASGLVEPVGAVLGAAVVSGSAAMLPWGLGFAAGAMLFVISHEIIPESHRKGHEAFATGGLMLGFVLMMVLDTALG